MSARVLLTTTRAAARPASILPLTARRTLTQTPIRPLKESSTSKRPRPSPSSPAPQLPSHTNPHHKQDSLAKQEQGKGHWKPELASVSEESIKADRSGCVKTDEETLKKLQEKTKWRAEETHKTGTSRCDGL
ncbi:hypothetical protein BT67DRAFT_424155 [Trichocladium antarcticum]|uniref:Uncharacterized protein n=1 Tax=Trichocladium antarcticum TaxID=1450529 RepID=A0AAN6UIA9_9PEZI|nr:hypothetical protein BT67DRAFT_424155 [Trichocladium antarcticum]